MISVPENKNYTHSSKKNYFFILYIMTVSIEAEALGKLAFYLKEAIAFLSSYDF